MGAESMLRRGEQHIRSGAALLLWLSLAVGPVGTNAQEETCGGVYGEVVINEIVFYIDPELVTDSDEAAESLQIYVEDMNHVLAKNTNRQLCFDQQNGVVTSSFPEHGYFGGGELPREDYKVLALVSQSAQPGYEDRVYGGWSSVDPDGNVVLTGLHWPQIYNPELLVEGSDATSNYATAIHHLLHEREHGSGAGVGEYYSLIRVDDTTGTEPTFLINAHDSNDPFWSNRQQYLSDPLLWNAYGSEQLGSPNSREKFLNATQFSPLTAAIINGSYRSAQEIPLPDMEQLEVRVVEQGGGLVNGAMVEVWNIVTYPPYESQLIAEGTTDDEGEFVFAWGGIGSPYSNVNMLRVIKVRDERYFPAWSAMTVFDLQATALLEGAEQFSIELMLEDKFGH